MDAIDNLLTRNSSPKLVEPTPSEHDLHTIYQAALRAPDHARLAPWRFLQIQGVARQHLGELFVQASEKKSEDLTESDKNKIKQKPLRAPLIIVAIADIQENPKVPEVEQLLSVGAAVQNILLAAHALGFAGIWRTGSMAFDATVKKGLGLSVSEQIVGFIYVGTREGKQKSLPQYQPSDFVSDWQRAL